MTNVREQLKALYNTHVEYGIGKSGSEVNAVIFLAMFRELADYSETFRNELYSDYTQ